MEAGTLNKELPLESLETDVAWPQEGWPHLCRVDVSRSAASSRRAWLAAWEKDAGDEDAGAQGWRVKKWRLWSQWIVTAGAVLVVATTLICLGQTSSVLLFLSSCLRVSGGDPARPLRRGWDVSPLGLSRCASVSVELSVPVSVCFWLPARLRACQAGPLPFRQRASVPSSGRSPLL